EILLKASEELKINPKDLEAYTKAEEMGMIQDLVASFTETYHIRTARIKKVIHDVIQNLPSNGYVVIVGRGGGTIAWDHPKALHLSLEAPLSWKSHVISLQKGISTAEARKFVLERDRQRMRFREAYRTKYADEIYYDLKLNCKVLSEEQIASLALAAAEIKKIF
ncbi:MAG: cytidylate kinase-like family protein, partial [Marinilabiliales bacterium]|nr:cytidylate kinase-like family protein [Marinilabiliales bacterium]